MPRINTPKAKRVLEAADAWKQACLLRDGSVFGAESIWNLANVRALENAFVGNLIDDPKRGFYDKFDQQLSGQPRNVVRLAAEFVWLYLLFPTGIDGHRKRNDILRIWQQSGYPPVTDHPLIAETLEGGIGRAGIAYNTHRWREFAFALPMLRAFKELPDSRRAELLSNPWQFAEWIDGFPDGRKRAFRNILLYLLSPDTFEPIAILRQKRDIVLHFSAAAGLGPTLRTDLKKRAALETDRRLMAIRQHLSSKYAGQVISFYHPPVSNEFDPRKKRAVREHRVTAPKSVDRHDASTVEPVVRLLSADLAVQEAALKAFVDVVEHAHRARPGSWSVSLGRARIRTNVGQALVFELGRKSVRVTVFENLVPVAIKEHLRERLEQGDTFASIAGARLIRLENDELSTVLPHLRDPLLKVVEFAAGARKKPTGIRAHSPAVLDYVEQRLHRALPRPSHQVTGMSGNGMPEAIPINTPLASFRATELDLEALVSDIDNGDIGLPDIQRPFVWTSTKVRDLFDSMYRGYPVGYLLFWQTNSQQQGVRTIGNNRKAFATPQRLIVDGQQRLTSLFAVMRGQEVLGDDYRRMRLEVAFRPRDGRFEVADAAIRRDPEFIADISKLFTDARGSYTLIKDFLSTLEAKRTLSARDHDIIGQNLERLFALRRYRFSVTEISADLDEEAVADIFVRINSEGVKLKQGDFILTLLSVIWDEGRSQLEDFSRKAVHAPDRPVPSPFNHLIKPSPDQMLRVSIAVGFRRARLRAVYQLLRGKDPDTGILSPERRADGLETLRGAQQSVLNLDNWHQFLASTTAAGYRLTEQISSENGLLQAYALYLVGKAQPGMDVARLNRLISRWYAMSNITARYSGSAETAMEQDLSRVASAGSAEAFAQEIEKAITSTLTPDFWTITLPVQLETSSLQSPGWSAFVAAQLRLNAPVLFSSALVDPRPAHPRPSPCVRGSSPVSQGMARGARHGRP